MKTKQLFRISLAAVAVVALIFSCKYEDVLPLEPDPGIQISFSQDIIPIFNSSCNTSGCHNGAGPSPDLRSTVAYSSLWDGGLIDTANVENSELYRWMNGDEGLPMPVTGKNSSYVATVKLWIEQGAKNN